MSHRRRPRFPNFESLEVRAMMIVGANGNLPGVALDLYSGVVHLAGDAASVPTDPRCSGTLLDSGRHILTAAHCIVQNEQQTIQVVPDGMLPLAGTYRLSFQGQQTSPIAWNASPATVETAMQDLPNIENVDCFLDENGNVVVEFLGNLAVTDAAQMTVSSQLVGGTVSINTNKSGAEFVGDVRFDLPSGSFVFEPEQTDVVIHPLFKNISATNEDGDQAGYDIAVITLPSIAPLGAQRYDTYDDRDEGNNLQVALVGYGQTGQGSLGEVPDSAGIRRAGFNTISGIDENTGYLLSDFDDGTTDNNRIGGLGLGDSEVMVVRGDSGGPGLIGDRVAGIHATIHNGWGIFGSLLYMTRVSDFVQGRDPLFDIDDIVATPDHIVLDMNLQDSGNDGAPDLIDIRLVGANDNQIEIAINNQVVWSDLRSRVLSVTIDGSGDSDFVTVNDDLGVDLTIRGNGGNDFIEGGAGEESIEGGEGNDELLGGSGNDTIIGGHGEDTIRGEAGNDRLIGGQVMVDANDTGMDASIDDLDGGSGNDSIFGDNGSVLPLVVGAQIGGHDQIRGGTGDDLIYAGPGNDAIHGQGGSDTITAGSGNDTVIGGSYVLTPGATPADGNDYLSGGDGHDFLVGDNLDPSIAFSVSLVGGNDEIYGGSGNDLIYGQVGHDTVYGNADDDQINGGIGNDTMYGGTGADSMWGESGLDLLFGNEQDDRMYGGSDNDILVGGSGNDTLDAGAGDDTASGESGADTLVGGLGNDMLQGGDDNDSIIGGNASVANDAGIDNIDGGNGDDIILGDSGTINPLVTTSALGGNDTIQGGPGNDTIYAMAGNDFVGGGSGNDWLYLGTGDDIANGDAGNDFLDGGVGNDVLAGSDGNDSISGASGDDWLIGGFFAAVGVAAAETGGDTINGGDGNDFMFGDSWSQQLPLQESPNGGADNMLGGNGNDFMAGGFGNDQLNGNVGNDVLNGGSGDDRIRGERGIDDLAGGAGNDWLWGGAENDILHGGVGNDILLGEAGDDELFGDDGRDLLIGGIGADRINGGNGEDLLLAGTTSFDSNDLALSQIMAEWSSVRTYVSRRDNLRGIVNPTYAVRANGLTFLRLGTTVFDDLSVDLLTGGLDRDWFWLNQTLAAPIDMLMDQEGNESIA